MSERLGPASVQYNDFTGTAALDRHGDASDEDIVKAAGLDPKEWAAVGFDVGYYEGFAMGWVDAIEMSRLATTKKGIPGLVTGDHLNATRFEMLDGEAEKFMKRFKRWEIRASYKGVPLRVKNAP